jgi:hypothetical protein
MDKAYNLSPQASIPMGGAPMWGTAPTMKNPVDNVVDSIGAAQPVT